MHCYCDAIVENRLLIKRMGVYIIYDVVPKKSMTQCSSVRPSHLPQRNIPQILALTLQTSLLLPTSLRPHLPTRHRKPSTRPRRTLRCSTSSSTTTSSLLQPHLTLPLMQLPTRIPQTPQDQPSHDPNRHRRPPRQDPPQALDLALLLAAQDDADLVVELANGAVARLTRHADGHAAVVEHAFEVVFEGGGLLGDALGEDVVGVLEVGELGAGLGRG